MLPSCLVVLHYAAEIVLYMERCGVDYLPQLAVRSGDDSVQTDKGHHGIGGTA